jgi:hypothetical protein
MLKRQGERPSAEPKRAARERTIGLSKSVSDPDLFDLFQQNPALTVLMISRSASLVRPAARALAGAGRPCRRGGP